MRCLLIYAALKVENVPLPSGRGRWGAAVGGGEEEEEEEEGGGTKTVLEAAKEGLLLFNGR